MKKTITKALVRGACLVTLAGFGLAVTPGTAQAAFIDFTVVEGVVPGTGFNTFTADLLNGFYSASLVLTGDADPTDGTGSGTWSEIATATFSQYALNGSALPGPFIGDAETNGYNIFGSLISSGTYTEGSNCGGGTFNCISFTFTSQTGFLGIDSNQDGISDIDLLNASGVGPGTTGSITFSGGVTGGTGSFVSNFANQSLAAGIAQSYWPTLDGISFITTISGDVNALDLPSVEGDVSVQFTETQQVPEPAALSLLGLGLVAGVFGRRRATKA